ncbi:MAG TPA: hypothetical protein VNT55_19835, partial [Baekduia sp.]|nr:hypothetical protein [Baekduia sp.]
MPRPMDLGRAVLFAGSALLLISLFTDWYDAGLAGSGVTGWQVFESLDLVLAGLAVGGIVTAIRPDLLPPWTHFAIPGIAIFVVAVQLIDAPPVARNASLAAGAWVALAGSFLMAAGAALSLAAISVTVQVRERDLRRRVAAVDRRGEDLEADEAEDLDADAPSGSLFGAGLGGGRSASTDDDAEPPKRTGRFAQRDTPAPSPVSSGTPAPARPEAADLERTQPL